MSDGRLRLAVLVSGSGTKVAEFGSANSGPKMRAYSAIGDE